MKHMDGSVTVTSGKLVGKQMNNPALKFWSNNDQLVMHTSLATHKTSARSDTRELSGKHVSIIFFTQHSYIYIWVLYLEFPFVAIPIEFAIVSAHSKPYRKGRG